MENTKKNKITVTTSVILPIDKVWKLWTNPTDIINWNFASDDWQTTKAENDLRIGGKFLSRMEAKDKSFSFDFWGFYDNIITNSLIEYSLGDDRKVKIIFKEENNQTKITETFEAETENTLELQQIGWQAILNNFKKYAESKY